MPEEGDLLGGRFLLVRRLGRGGAGVVFAAHDTRLNQKVAVKVLDPSRIDPDSLERLRREVQAARGGHPHTVTVYDLHQAGGLHFLSMELVEGGTLRDRIEAESTLPVEEVIRIGGEVASALVHLHHRGIVHRDVKPANILLTPDGTARLGDMGLARPLEQGLTVTETAMVVGTPAYMAPEQATGAELTPAADVYALGLTLHQALTGEVPLCDATALSTLVRRQKERPPSVRRAVPGVPRWFARLLHRMLDPDPRERPTADRVARAIASRRFRTRPRRRVLLAAGLLLAVAAAIPVLHGAYRRDATVRIEVGENEVRGLDGHGRVTWRRALEAPPESVVEADLDGDGSRETVIATAASRGARDEAGEPARLVAFDRRGHIAVSAELRGIIRRWAFPYPIILDPEVSACDLDLDGRSELIVLCRQRHFYPTVLLVYWPARDRWQGILEHPGHLRVVVGVPDATRPSLVFAGVTNRPLMAPVAGRILLDPRSPGDAWERLEPGRLETTGHATWDWYTLLRVTRSTRTDIPVEIEALESGRFLLTPVQGAPLELDRWGNPADGPNAGRDLREARLRFMQVLLKIRTPQRYQDPASIRAEMGRLRRAAAPLLRELPYRIALDLTEARARARGHDLVGAIALLQATRREVTSDDIDYRLAHLLGIAGRLREAVHLLERSVATGSSQRAVYDGRILLHRLAIELHDHELAERCIVGFKTYPTGRFSLGVQAAVQARAHLWWDEIREADCRVRSWPYEPAGSALACLARWRRGHTRPGDPEAMREEARANPDAPYEYPLAEAAALLALGRPKDALAALETLMPSLGKSALEDFGDHQLLDLARALHAAALARAGDLPAARDEASTLLGRLTPRLLPAILAREVQEGTWDARAG